MHPIDRKPNHNRKSRLSNLLKAKCRMVESRYALRIYCCTQYASKKKEGGKQYFIICVIPKCDYFTEDSSEMLFNCCHFPILFQIIIFFVHDIRFRAELEKKKQYAKFKRARSREENI